MKDYTSPELYNMDEILERVYAAGSGWVPEPDDEEEPTPDNPDWEVTRKSWGTHNSGHHSDLFLGVRNKSGKGIAGIKVTFEFGLPVESINSISWPQGKEGTCTVNGNSVIITHPGAYNPNEEVGFSFNQMHFNHNNSSLVCSDGQLVKAYVAPIDGGWGSNIPIGSEAIITVG